MPRRLQRHPVGTFTLATALAACLAAGGALAADRGARHHAQGQFDTLAATYVVTEGDDLTASQPYPIRSLNPKP
jgi:hypothetical protein